jgi:tetratricopeptide (TPR) repeat protein
MRRLLVLLLLTGACATTGPSRPTDPRAAAEQALDEGRMADVIAHLAPLVDDGTATPDDLVTLAEAYLRRGAAAQALLTSEAALARRPADQEARGIAGKASYLLGKHMEAIEHLEEAVAGGAPPEVSLLLASLYLETGALESAKKQATRAAARLPESAEAQSVLGRTLAAAGDLRGAEAALRAAVRLSPDDAAALFHLGNLYAASGSLLQAADQYQAALERNPSMVEAMRNLGAVYVMAGVPEEAIPVLKKAAEVAPDSPEIHNNLGVAYTRVDKLPEAIVAFRAALAAAPEEPGLRHNLADALYRDGQFDEALAVAQEGARDPAGAADAAALARKIAVTRAVVASRCAGEKDNGQLRKRVDAALGEAGIPVTEREAAIRAVLDDEEALLTVERATSRCTP